MEKSGDAAETSAGSALSSLQVASIKIEIRSAESGAAAVFLKT
jgi:hypothetical protein